MVVTLSLYERGHLRRMSCSPLPSSEESSTEWTGTVLRLAPGRVGNLRVRGRPSLVETRLGASLTSQKQKGRGRRKDSLIKVVVYEK